MLACVALLSAVAVLASESDQAAFEANVRREARCTSSRGKGATRGS